MTAAMIRIEQLISYSDHEREKWNAWVKADPARLQLPFQPGGRFPTSWSLLDHIFLVERRHLSRLQGATPPDSTGVAPGDWQALVEYGALVRADLRRYISDLDEQRAAETITFTIPTGPLTTTRVKLAAHILLHEVRHLAQLVYAVRLARLDPPGEHDYLFCPEP